MLPAVISPLPCEPTMELKLGVCASAQEDSPLPHATFLRYRGVHVLEGPVQEEGNSEEEFVSRILNLEVYPCQCYCLSLLLVSLQLPDITWIRMTDMEIGRSQMWLTDAKLFFSDLYKCINFRFYFIKSLQMHVHHCLFHSYYGYTERLYGPNTAAAFYILNIKGGFR